MWRQNKVLTVLNKVKGQYVKTGNLKVEMSKLNENRRINWLAIRNINIYYYLFYTIPYNFNFIITYCYALLII